MSPSSKNETVFVGIQYHKYEKRQRLYFQTPKYSVVKEIVFFYITPDRLYQDLYKSIRLMQKLTATHFARYYRDLRSSVLV